MNNWERVRLGEVVSQNLEYIESPEPIEYKKLSVKLYGRGVTLDGTVDGASVKMKKHQLAKEGQVILSEIWGKKGAIGFVPKEGEGALCTSHFFLFEVNREKIDPAFLRIIFIGNLLEKQLSPIAFGSTGYAATRPKHFLNVEIPLPPLTEQARIVARLESVQRRVAEVRALRQEQAALMAGLAAGSYREITKVAPLRRMGDIAPLVRRPVEVKDEENYPELGVRSFGKGTFHKPDVPGFEVGTKQLYHIRPGDLVFSNVFAWEGAIAVAKPEDAGRVGSHRFITCVADEKVALAEFLCYHFLTTEGLKQIQEASPGGAGRNRTLGLTKLEALNVPLPPLAQQREFVVLLQKAERLRAASAESEALLEGLLPGVLAEVFGEG